MATIGWDAEGNPINGDAVVGWDAEGRPVRRREADRPQPTAPSRTIPDRQQMTAPTPQGGNILQQARRAITGEGQRRADDRELTMSDLDRNPETGASGVLRNVTRAIGLPEHIQRGAQQIGSGLDAEFSPEGQAVSWGFFLDPNERSRADIIRKNVPDAEWRRDEYGTLQFRRGASRPWVSLNSAGIGQADVQTVANEAGKYYATSRIPGLRQVATTPLPRIAQAGATAALGTGLGQAAAIPLGGRGPNVGDIAMSGAGGAGGQAAGDLVIAPAVRAVAPIIRRPAGEVAQEAGDAVAARQTAQAAESLTPDPRIAGYAEADEFAIPLTRGQASGKPRARQTEDDMLTGGSSEAAQNVMGRFADRQAQAIEEAGVRLATRGAEPLGSTIDDAGIALQSSLTARREALEAAADKAYDKAFAVARTERVAQSDELGARVAAVNDEVFMPSGPATAVVDKLQGLISRGSATYADVERARQALNRVASTAAKSGDDSALFAVQRVKQELDDWAASSMRSPQARATFDDSRQVFSELKDLYGTSGPKDLGGRAVERAIELERTGQQIAESILGAGNRPPQQALAAVRQIRKIATTTTKDGRIAARPGATRGAKGFQAGQLPEEMQALREATFRRVLSPLGNRREGSRIPVQTVITNLESALSGPGKEIFDELFTPIERAAVERYVAVLKRVVPPDGVGRSGTAQTAMRMIQAATGDVFNRLFGIVVTPAKDLAGYYGAKSAIARPNLVSLPPRRTAASIGAGAAVDASQPDE